MIATTNTRNVKKMLQRIQDFRKLLDLTVMSRVSSEPWLSYVIKIAPISWDEFRSLRFGWLPGQAMVV